MTFLSREAVKVYQRAVRKARRLSIKRTPRKGPKKG
jgi:hypothetical protein